MKILVWGLGYVGTITAACLAELGHDVIGVETNSIKVKAINQGDCTIEEPGLKELIRKVVNQGHLRATVEGSSLVTWADLSLICVGTPSMADGRPNYQYIEQVTTDIGLGLRDSKSYHVVVLRSTVFPSISRDLVCSKLSEYSNKQPIQDFGLVVNPEFMREGNTIDDFFNPPYTIIGEMDTRSGDLVEELYQYLPGNIYRTSLEEAEFLKLVNNAFHSLKIGFANEIGRFCDSLNLDSHKIMEMVCADTKLNISPAYLKPGFAFGGSCLPKDLRSLEFQADQLNVEIPIVKSILPSNTLHIKYNLSKIISLNVNHLGVLGLSFKAGTNDLRESPVIELIHQLSIEGIKVFVYDPEVKLETLLGVNKEYMGNLRNMDNILLCEEIENVLEECQAIVVTYSHPQFVPLLERLKQEKPQVKIIQLQYLIISSNLGKRESLG